MYVYGCRWVLRGPIHLRPVPPCHVPINQPPPQNQIKHSSHDQQQRPRVRRYLPIAAGGPAARPFDLAAEPRRGYMEVMVGEGGLMGVVALGKVRFGAVGGLVCSQYARRFFGVFDALLVEPLRPSLHSSIHANTKLNPLPTSLHPYPPSTTHTSTYTTAGPAPDPAGALLGRELRGAQRGLRLLYPGTFLSTAMRIMF